MPSVKRICQECGTEFWVQQSWLDFKPGRGQFCSKHCSSVHRKRQSECTVLCLECSAEFKTQQHLVRRGEGKFCSQSCAAIFNNRERSTPLDSSVLSELYYTEKLSLTEIADRLGCSVHKVAYWMDQYQITRRHLDEAGYLKHNPKGNPFKIKEPETETERELFNLAIGLYLGEGTKNKERVSFANTDPGMIRTFLRFLRETCGVEEKKIFAYLNIFDDVDLEEAFAYWQEVTGLPRSQFYKPTVRPSKGQDYKNKSKYGTLSVGLSNTKLASQIGEWCRSALRKFG